MRISPIAPPGSLLKGAAAKPRKGRKPGRHQIDDNPSDPKYLALVRRCPCLGCDNDPAKVAAHVRMTRVGKPITGAGLKPGDRWALPLCATCHTDGGKAAQHQAGEVLFWQRLGIDPLPLCQRLHKAGGIEAMRKACFAAREGRK